jgi:hypothetical protein
MWELEGDQGRAQRKLYMYVWLYMYAKAALFLFWCRRRCNKQELALCCELLMVVGESALNGGFRYLYCRY